MRIWSISNFFRKIPHFFIKTPFDNERLAFFTYYYSGNAKPLYELVVKKNLFKKPYWVLMTKKEVKKLKDKGVEAYYYRDKNASKIFLSTPIWISTHVEDNFPIVKQKNFIDFLKYTIINFLEIESPPQTDKKILGMQLWHGLGFKAWRKERKRDYLIHSDIYCFTSDYFKKVWVDQFKIDPDKIKITGYARHDMLINRDFDADNIKKQIGLNKNYKIILFAPTWEQRKNEKSIYYWNFNKINEINQFCKENNAYFIIRTHHMQKTSYKKLDLSNFKYIPVDKFPDTMSLLAVTDILVTDWSSIANDFIFLNRPTIFIDIKNPFDDDFSLLPQDRAGFILKNKNDLVKYLKRAFNNEKQFIQQYESVRKHVLKKIYNKPDGNATKRCIDELIKLKEKIPNQ